MYKNYEDKLNTLLSKAKGKFVEEVKPDSIEELKAFLLKLYKNQITNK